MKTEILPAGKLVFGEGDPGHEAFLIKKGSVEVSIEDREQKVVLANLGEGEIFGEMAMIENRPRSASARALTETEVEIIDRDEFLEALKADARKLLPFLSTIFERLRVTNDRLVAALDRLDELEPSEPHHHEAFGLEQDSVVVRLEPDSEEMRRQTSLEGVVIRHYPFLFGRRGEVVGADALIQNQLLLAEPPPYRVSRKHCLIDLSGDDIFVEDHTSKLGTIVNGNRIGGSSRETRARLSAGENTLVLGGPDSQARFKLSVESV
jgi:CRP/FNR family cyclic AMP-dependent transcriptional regulator